MEYAETLMVVAGSLMACAIIFLIIALRWAILKWSRAAEDAERWYAAFQRKRDEVDRIQAEAHGVGGTGEAAGVHVHEVGRMPIRSGGSARIGPAGHMAYVPLPTDRRS